MTEVVGISSEWMARLSVFVGHGPTKIYRSHLIYQRPVLLAGKTTDADTGLL
jgi:hypothetical protein